MSALEFEDLDRRQDRTRTAIRRAFLSLLFENNYPAVTMAAVAERANVGRSTLYEHFRTKDDLFRDTVRVPMSGLAELVDTDTLPEPFGELLQHFRDNQALGRVLVYLPAYGSMQKVLAELIETRLGKSDLMPASLVATQIAAAQFAILTPWILGQVALSPAVLAEALHRSSRAMAGAYSAAIRPKSS
jgi:AcrR family transcriptional regulator